MERMSIAFSPTPLFLTFTFCLQTTLRALDQKKKKKTQCLRSPVFITKQLRSYQSPKSSSGGSKSKLPWPSVTNWLWITKKELRGTSFDWVKLETTRYLFLRMTGYPLGWSPVRVSRVLSQGHCSGRSGHMRVVSKRKKFKWTLKYNHLQKQERTGWELELREKSQWSNMVYRSCSGDNHQSTWRGKKYPILLKRQVKNETKNYCREGSK